MLSLFEKKVILVSVVLLFSGLIVQGFFIDIFNQQENDSKELETDNDVVLITVDSLRKDYLDCENSFGETPNICGLRNDSASFSNSYSHASYTTAAMSAVMTGRYPWNIDMLDIESSELPEDVDTLAEVLEKRGYRNYGSWEIGGVAPDYGFNRGFDRYINSEIRAEWDEWSKGEEDLWLLEAAKHDDEPSFLYYHLFGPHQPFRTSESCENFSWRLRETPWEGSSDVKPKYRENFSKEKAEDCYREAVRLSDRRVGDIIERLKENEQYNDSIIIFTSDHGEGLWDNRIFGHSQTVYEEQINIPLYVKFPDTGYFNDFYVRDHDFQRYDEIKGGYARHVDIYPTVLDYLRIKDDFSDRPGESLLPVIRGHESLDTDSVKATSVVYRGMIIDDFKVVETLDKHAFGVVNQFEYFENVTGNKSEIQREDIHQRYIDRFVSDIPEIKVRSPGENQRERHDEELIGRLEELGYVS